MSLRRSTRVSKRVVDDDATLDDEDFTAAVDKPKRARKGKAAADDEHTTVEQDAQLAQLASKAATKKQAAKAARSTKREETAREREEDARERGAYFRKSCPVAVTTRISRAMNQRLFLLSRSKPEGACGCARGTTQHTDFSVLGSTGNVYTVKICRQQTCDCPDGQRDSQCKHILFVMLKVLQVARSSPLLYQDALLPSELEEIFASAPSGRTQVEAPKAALDAFKKMSGDVDADAAGPDAPAEDEPKPKAFAGEFCGICYDVLAETDAVAWCKSSCGKSVHKDCFTHWENAQRAIGTVTCVYCRAPWQVEGAAGAGAGAGPASAEGYTNLAHLSGQTAERSDYDGDRRYGYYRNWY